MEPSKPKTAKRTGNNELIVVHIRKHDKIIIGDEMLYHQSVDAHGNRNFVCDMPAKRGTGLCGGTNQRVSGLETHYRNAHLHEKSMWQTEKHMP